MSSPVPPTPEPESGPVEAGLVEVDRDGRVTIADDAFRRLALSGGPVPTGRAPWANAGPDERMAAESAWRRAVDARRSPDISFRVDVDGTSTRLLRFVAAPNDEADGYRGVVFAVDQANTLADRIAPLLDDADDPVLLLATDGTVLSCNRSGGEKPALARAIVDQMPRHALTEIEGTWHGEVAVRLDDGDLHTFDVRTRRDTDAVVAIAREITESARVHAELSHLATHDALTGLPNRTLFIRKVSEAVERSRSGGSSVTVYFLDVDRLKDVNDTIGHESGDQLIVGVGRRLVTATRPGDLVGRISGDEFTILCEGLADERAALDLAERIRLAVSGRMMLQGVDVTVGASVGVAFSRGDDGSSLAEAAIALLRHADSAMYEAKSRGRSRSELYTSEMRESARARLRLAADLERAMAADQMRLVYQPVESLSTGRVVGVEALLRWHHPEHGVLAPPAFITLAEESGVIVPLGEWVARTACADLRRWIDAGTIDRRAVMHVNVSPRQTSDPTFVDRTLAAVRDAGLQPEALALDVGESVLAHEGAQRALQAIRRFGVQLSIDDFGTGASSLSGLRSCPADFLKLDGSFVRGLADDESDDPIVRSVIHLAHSLGMSVIAEWVTTDSQRDRLRRLGCDRAQGWLIGRPVSADDFGRRTGTVEAE